MTDHWLFTHLAAGPHSFECPVCGADVPARAKACPGCGSDERTGWREDDDHADDADLPAGYEGEDDFDYNDFVRREFGRPRNRAARRWLWIAIAVAALLLFAALALLPIRAP
jgi:hypothetical protein